MSKKSLVEDPDQKSIGAPSKLLENGKLQQKEDQSPANPSRAFGSLGDLYFSESAGTLDTNSDSSQTSPSSGVMTDRVQRIASSIYAEFKVMIETYGLPVVERLMPLVVGLLENLDELYKDQAAYHEEVYQLRDQNSFMVGELEREKDRRKQAELVGIIVFHVIFRFIVSSDIWSVRSCDLKLERLQSTMDICELQLHLFISWLCTLFISHGFK